MFIYSTGTCVTNQNKSTGSLNATTTTAVQPPTLNQQNFMEQSKYSMNFQQNYDVTTSAPLQQQQQTLYQQSQQNAMPLPIVPEVIVKQEYPPTIVPQQQNDLHNLNATYGVPPAQQFSQPPQQQQIVHSAGTSYATTSTTNIATENYLPQSIPHIVNQTIGQSNNVQHVINNVMYS